MRELPLRVVHIEECDHGYHWRFSYDGRPVEERAEPTAREAVREGLLRAMPAEGGNEPVALIGGVAVLASIALVFLDPLHPFKGDTE